MTVEELINELSNYPGSQRVFVDTCSGAMELTEFSETPLGESEDDDEDIILLS